MDAPAFLSALFGDAVGDPGELVIWESSTKRSAWCRSIEEAVAAAERLAPAANVYYGTSLQDRAAALAAAHAEDEAKKRPPRALEGTRGFSRTAVAIGSISADLDFPSASHKKPGLAPNMHAILSKLGHLPAQPSIVLNSGGGGQLHWVFKEPLVLETAEDRTSFERKQRGWQRFLEQELGFTVDPTADLARVLRMPGFPNHKYPNTLSTVVAEFPARYNPSDFDPWELGSSTKSAAEVNPGLFDGIRIDPNAQPHLGKVMALAAMDAQFRATWTRKRAFKSQSEYDMSLASYAARYGWSDQEVVDLCIAHRREGGEKEKLRPDYFRLLLAKVRGEPEKTAARESLEVATQRIEKGEIAEADARPAMLEDLSKTLGVPIRKIVRHLCDPPRYRIDLPDCSITLPTVETILNPKLFEAAVAAGARRVIASFKRSEWKPIAQSILTSCVDEDIGVDADPGTLTVEMLSAFLSQTKPFGEEERAKALEQRRPWLQGGDVWFWLGEFASWVSVRGGERMSRKALACALRKAGAIPHVVRIPHTGSTANAWRIDVSSVHNAQRETETAGGEAGLERGSP